MQITSAGVEISGTNYTWQQSLWFFFLGAVWAVAAAMPPVLWALWHNYQNYNDPIDWTLIRGMAIAAASPALLGYWQKHKALLQVPPYFKIPPEFHPGMKQVETTTQTLDPGPPKTVTTVKETHVEPMEGGTDNGTH